MDRLKALLLLKWKIAIRSSKARQSETILRVVTFALVLMSIGCVTLFMTITFREFSPADRTWVFPVFSWLLAIAWLISPFSPVAVARSLHFEGLALLPLTKEQFAYALVINALVDFMGAFVPALIISAVIVCGDSPVNALFALLISLVFWTGLLITGQLILLTLGRILSSRRFADIAMIFGTFFFALLIFSRFLYFPGASTAARGAAPDVHKLAAAFEAFNRYTLYLPPGLAGWSFNSADAGNYGQALLALALLAGEILILIYFSGWVIEKFFVGELSVGGTVRARTVRGPEARSRGEAANGGGFLSLLGVSERVRALVAKEWKYIFREPIYKMRLINNLFFVFYFAFLFALGGGAGHRSAGISAWFIPLFAYLSVIGELRAAANKFGMDGAAVECLLLSPILRQEVMIAKVITSVVFFQSINLVILVAGGALFHFSPLLILLSILAMIAGATVIEAWGNILSVYFPYRMSYSSGRRGQPTFETGGCTFQLTYMLATMAGNALLAPLLAMIIAPYYLGAPWVGVFLFPVAAALAAFVLVWSLKFSANKLLEREHAIIELLTRPLE